MKVASIFFAALILVSFTGTTSAAGIPCEDEMYLELKSKGIDDMSAREYQTFERLSGACDNYKTNSAVVSESKDNSLSWLLLGSGLLTILLFL